LIFIIFYIRIFAVLTFWKSTSNSQTMKEKTRGTFNFLKLNSLKRWIIRRSGYLPAGIYKNGETSHF
jgi:hypothetical protein